MATVEELHVRLDAYTSRALDFIQMKHSDISRNAATKTCIRSVAIWLGYAAPPEYEDLKLEDLADRPAATE